MVLVHVVEQKNTLRPLAVLAPVASSSTGLAASSSLLAGLPHHRERFSSRMTQHFVVHVGSEEIDAPQRGIPSQPGASTGGFTTPTTIGGPASGV